MPALRLGALLLSRAGFTLQQVARLWDAFLADPHRFEFADHVVIALLLLSRGDLLQRDNVGGIAETLLAAPSVVDFELLLHRAYAVCAFQRRHGPRSQMPFPRPQGLDLDGAVAAAQESLSSLWGKVRAAGAGYWEAVWVAKACERLAAQLREFRKQGLYCDVVLLAAGTRYAAHRAVLAAQGLLQPGDMTSELRIVGISKKTFVALLDRLYGETSPTSGDVNPFCDALGLGGDSGVGAVHLAQRLHEMREITGDLQLCCTTGHSIHAHRVVLAAGCEVLSEFLSSTAEASGDTYELTLQSISDMAALQAAVDTVYLGTPMSSCGEDAELLCSSWQLPQSSRSPPPGSEVVCQSKCVKPLVPAARILEFFLPQKWSKNLTNCT
eukprot:symbB.v1.2.019556.t1/scaffold1601.1/size109688/9